MKAVAVTGSGKIRVAQPQQLLKEWHEIGKYTINPEHKFLLYDRKKNDATYMLKNAKPICSQSCVNNCHTGIYRTTTDSRILNTFCIGRSISGKMNTEYSLPTSKLRIPAVKEYGQKDSVALLEMFDRLGVDYWMRATLQTWLTVLKEASINSLCGYSLKPDSSE